MPYFGTDLKQFGYAATEKDTFSGDDSTVAFTLSKTSTTNDVEVFVGNVQQEPTIAYSISGSTLTFTEAPPTGTNNIYVLHRGRTRDTILPSASFKGTTSLNEREKITNPTSPSHSTKPLESA